MAESVVGGGRVGKIQDGWVCWTAVIDYHERVPLKQQRSILSQFRRLEVRNQGVGRATFPLKAPEEDLFSVSVPFFYLPALLAALGVPRLERDSASVGTWQSPCVSFVPKFLLFYKDTSHRLGPVLIWHDLTLTLLHLQKTCFQIRSH